MKILFFAPHSAIWVHAFPEALVAEALQQSGAELVYVTCGEVLQERCTAMSAFGLGFTAALPDRQRICRICSGRADTLRRRLGLRGYDLSAVLTADDRRRVDAIMDATTRENYLDLKLFDLPVGKLALYEVLLHRKKGNLALADDEWEEYKKHLRGTLIAALCGTRILDQERPDRVVTYNSLYAVNRVVSLLARRHGALDYFLHAGGNLSRRLQTLMIGRESTIHYLKVLVSQWHRFRHQACSPRAIEQITDHVLVLRRGQSVFGYSVGADRQRIDVRALYGIEAGQKLIVATMSSPDERFAAQTIGALPPEGALLFPTQVEWIQALLKFVAGRPDLFLLIRVHPREFPNKREGVKSEHGRLLEAQFAQLPANAGVNWPADGVSLYDLAEDTDAFMNAWSSAGKEMALLGIPVISYSPELLGYPAELNYVGTTEEQLFAMVDAALAEGRSLERSRMVYRWLAVEYGWGLVDIADGYPRSEYRTYDLRSRVIRRLWSLVNRRHEEDADCRRRPARLAAGNIIDSIFRQGLESPLSCRSNAELTEGDVAAETAGIRASLRRLGLRIA
jgi:hypothetical protein